MKYGKSWIHIFRPVDQYSGPLQVQLFKNSRLLLLRTHDFLTKRALCPDPSRPVVFLVFDQDVCAGELLTNRWKDTPARFSDCISEQGIRNMLHKIADEAGIRPYKIDGSRGTPDDVTPHALCHGITYRMMNAEDGNTLCDVRSRLRYRSIQTTERIYDHMLKV
jgi:integrase